MAFGGLGDDHGFVAPEGLDALGVSFGGIFESFGVRIVGGVGVALAADVAAGLVVIDGAAEIDELFFPRLGTFDIQ
jgi:hypothetical protein